MCTPCDRLEGREGTTQRVDEESAARTRKGKKRRKRMIEVSGGIQKKEAKRGEREREGGVEYTQNNVARSRARTDLTNQESILLSSDRNARMETLLILTSIA